MTQLFAALSFVLRLAGSVKLYSKGSCDPSSLWMSIDPSRASLTTRRRPFSSGPPERAIETPTTDGASSALPAATRSSGV